MSDTTLPNESQAPDAAKEPGRTRTGSRRSSLQSGFSLLARGEPKIWFTGGMLIVCLTMIVGLLALILAYGLPAFWPVQIDLLALEDGSLEMGQPTAKQVVPESADDAVNDGLRRNYRTGNFELTNQHYRWLEPNQYQMEHIASPEWALVIERLTWGRFYGIPLRMTEDLSPSPAARERLARLEVLTQILSDTLVSSEDAAEVELGNSVLESLQLTNLAIRDESLRSILESRQQDSTASLFVQFDGADDWVPLEALKDESVEAARVTWRDPTTLYDTFETHLQTVLTNRGRSEHLKYEISRSDARLSGLRAGIRRAELDTETQVAVQVEAAHYWLEEQVRLEELVNRLSTLEELLKEVVEDEDLNQQAVAAIERYRVGSLKEEQSSLDQQLTAWLEPTATQPPSIRKAIDEYLDGYRKIVSIKRPLEAELAELELELESAAVECAVSSHSQLLIELDKAAVTNLLQGELSTELQTKLNEQGLDTANLDVHSIGLTDQFHLVSLHTQADSQMLAVSLPSPGDAGTGQATLFTKSVIPLKEIVRAVPVNQLGLGGKLAVYGDRWLEFLWENPREANTEGGVFPAIWGTIVMTLIMTIAVVPFGVMAALYLREYTKSGLIVSIIRISINNLAGVPSIVYGVFGFSFFCYTIGAYVDGGAKNADITPWPPVMWFVILGLVAVVGTTAFFCSFLSGGPSHSQTSRKIWMSRIGMVCWLVSIVTIALLVLKSPFFDGFYREYLPNPTFGKGGLLWASLTLSLLTLPVVIVATEEALSAVPNSLREGSLACGASKWQTIRRIVLPHARPGILTGAILAMARGAGEVAPLMLVGALPTAPDLPMDTEFPFFHGSRSFMHLGYQIYTLGFQSQNSEAAKPVVFTCTLLLILIVAALNISAIYLRARLKRKFLGGNQF